MKKSRAATRTIDILELIASESKGLSLTEIASILNIPVTSASDIINALLEKEMIEIIDNRSKVYGIGVKSYFIGNAFIANTTIVDKSKEIIEELGKSTNKTVFLGKEVNGKITYIYKYEPKNNLVATCPIGARNNLHCTSLGKCILAHDDKLLKSLEDKELAAKTKHTITDYNVLRKEIEVVRNQGYAVDDKEQNDHLLCIGAPVFDNRGDVIAAVSISGLHMESTDIEGEAQLVKDCAMKISKKMGYFKW